MTTPKQRATAQNAAIASADLALQREDLPTFTETILALDALASATDADEIAKARNIAINVVMRATGEFSAMPSFWMQRFGRAYRPGKHPRELAQAICAEAQCEDVKLDHFRIRAPADRLEAVRAHVEARRVATVFIEYLPRETDK